MESIGPDTNDPYTRLTVIQGAGRIEEESEYRLKLAERVLVAALLLMDGELREDRQDVLDAANRAGLN